MKQIWMIVLAGLFMIGFSSLAFTQENKDDMTDMISKGMQEVSKMSQGKMKGKGDICEMMMGKSLVATADGGVVVWLGNKLFKYDKDLVLQKEGEIKIDMEGMQKMMKKCSMSGKMRSEGDTKEEPKGQTMSPQFSGQETQHSH
jgi:hypothetical protein